MCMQIAFRLIPDIVPFNQGSRPPKTNSTQKFPYLNRLTLNSLLLRTAKSDKYPLLVSKIHGAWIDGWDHDVIFEIGPGLL